MANPGRKKEIRKNGNFPAQLCFQVLSELHEDCYLMLLEHHSLKIRIKKIVTQNSCRKSILSALALFAIVLLAVPAQARHLSRHSTLFGHHFSSFDHRRFHFVSHVLQCVAFAKEASNVVLHGNARDWWYNAAGVYARGSAPEEGSVLNFRGIRRMPLGHVAVVRQVADNRTIYIDQSHWASNGISRNVMVVDVSARNDWSAVRVALNDHTGRLGSIYPTYGFIYGRPAAPNATSSLILTRDETSIQHRRSFRYTGALSHPMNTTEVAEAPDTTFASDAPDRSIR